MSVETLFQRMDTIATQYPLYLEGITHSCYQMLEEGVEEPIEERRRALQLAVVKGMKEGIQANHQMTPEVIGLFIGYLMKEWVEEKDTLVDVGTGTGQLLYSVLAQLSPKNVAAYGIEGDETLIQLAAATGEFLQRPVQFYMQDAVTDWPIKDVDFIISDVPTGYYPLPHETLQMKLSEGEKRAQIHQLFIERSIRQLHENGYAIFIVPTQLFVQDTSEKWHQFLQNDAILRAMFQLPSSLFKKEEEGRSIIVMQRRTPHRQYDKEVYVAAMPSFDQIDATERFFYQAAEWAKGEKERKRSS